MFSAVSVYRLCIATLQPLPNLPIKLSNAIMVVTYCCGIYVYTLLIFRTSLQDIPLLHPYVLFHAFSVVVSFMLINGMILELSPIAQFFVACLSVINAVSVYLMVLRGKMFKIIPLNGKVAIVTGANGGIGLECARQLARLGAHVILGLL